MSFRSQVEPLQDHWSQWQQLPNSRSVRKAFGKYGEKVIAGLTYSYCSDNNGYNFFGRHLSSLRGIYMLDVLVGWGSEPT